MQVVQQAAAMWDAVRSDVFFNKLASLGITPSNEQEAGQLLELGGVLLQQYPRQTAGVTVKQAGMEVFGADSVSPIAATGYSQEAHDAVDWLCNARPDLVHAAGILVQSNR
jgi:hypothetical protein